MNQRSMNEETAPSPFFFEIDPAQHPELVAEIEAKIRRSMREVAAEMRAAWQEGNEA